MMFDDNGPLDQQPGIRGTRHRVPRVMSFLFVGARGLTIANWPAAQEMHNEAVLGVP